MEINYTSSAICFNGGKDSTVVLSLLHKIIDVTRIKVFYLKHNDSFEEIDKFVWDMASKYKLNLYVYKLIDMKKCLEQIKVDHPEIDTIVMGTRQSDVNYPIEYVDTTTEGWPKFKLINPIKDWDYGQVWKYIIDHKLEVCSLYEEGYTSIGEKSNTIKNEYLLNENGEYLHASLLKDYSKERCNRKKN